MALKIASPKVPPLESLPPVIVADVLAIRELYPNISNRILGLWGSIQLHKFLNQIIIDERGNRQGFPQPVISALLRVHQCHTELFPNAMPPCDAWDNLY